MKQIKWMSNLWTHNNLAQSSRIFRVFSSLQMFNHLQMFKPSFWNDFQLLQLLCLPPSSILSKVLSPTSSAPTTSITNEAHQTAAHSKRVLCIFSRSRRLLWNQTRTFFSLFWMIRVEIFLPNQYHGSQGLLEPSSWRNSKGWLWSWGEHDESSFDLLTTHLHWVK